MILVSVCIHIFKGYGRMMDKVRGRNWSPFL